MKTHKAYYPPCSRIISKMTTEEIMKLTGQNNEGENVCFNEKKERTHPVDFLSYSRSGRSSSSSSSLPPRSFRSI